jgi:glutamyl-tRNA synthetase
MVNFLALLGWSPGNDQELFGRDALVSAFSLEGIGGGDAVFDTVKLDWFNAQHIARLAPDDLARRLQPWYEAAGLWSDDLLGNRREWFFAVLELLRPRVRRLDDFVAQSTYFLANNGVQYDPAAVDKHLRAAGTSEHLAALDAALAELEDFDPVSIEAALRTVADARGVKVATLIHAVRVALTGRTVGPGLFEVMALLGRDRTRARLAAACRMFSSPDL